MVGREEFMDIHELWVRGRTVSEIARLTGRDRKTVRRVIEGGGPQPRKTREVTSKLDPFREYLLGRMLDPEDPVDNTQVLLDEIRAKGYTGGRSILKEFLQPFRALAKDKTTERFETPPGKQAQVDWGSFRKPRCHRVQGFVMTLGWSRASYLDFEDSQALPLFLACHERAFDYLGGVPDEILYDRVKTVWLRDDEHGDPVFHPGFLDFARYYGFRPRLCRGRRPQTKGKVESGIKYVRRNFWPRVTGYERAHDLLGQRTTWLTDTCNVRVHGTTGERPVDRLLKEGLRSVAGVSPYRALVLERRRVARDSFVSYAGSWYSVPAEYARREVWVRQTEDRLLICEGDEVLATHRLADRPFQRLVNREHFRALAMRRDLRLQFEVDEALSRAPRLPLPVGPEVEKRSLAVYEALS